MTGPIDTRPLVAQLGWLASGLGFLDLVEVAEILGLDPDGQELLDAWRACGLPEPSEDVSSW